MKAWNFEVDEVWDRLILVAIESQTHRTGQANVGFWQIASMTGLKDSESRPALERLIARKLVFLQRAGIYRLGDRYLEAQKYY